MFCAPPLALRAGEEASLETGVGEAFTAQAVSSSIRRHWLKTTTLRRAG
jgi:hypothetical protein